MSQVSSIYARQWHSPENGLIYYGKWDRIEKLILKGRAYDASNELAKLKNINKKNCLSRRYRRVERILAKKGRSIKLYFSGFWATFNTKDNPLRDLVEIIAKSNCGEIVETQDRLSADIIICSCYEGNANFEDTNATIISYLPEPVYPEYTFSDYSISQYNGSCDGRNLYLPLYLFELKGGFVKSDYPDRCEQPTNIKEVYLPQRSHSLPPNRICIVAGNMNPIRMDILKVLEGGGHNVSKYGAAFNNPIQSKDVLKGKYRYMICPENGIVPGYISEKLIHAKRLEMIPIYWGFGTSSKIVNNQSMIEYSSEYPDIICKKINSMTTEEYIKMRSEPILDQPFDYVKLFNQLSNLLNLYIK